MRGLGATIKQLTAGRKNPASRNCMPEPQDSNKAALKEALIKCRKEIKKSKRWKILPSPKGFEHAAMLSRQAKNYQNEIKICQLYISLVDNCVSRRTFNKKNVEKKAYMLCEPLRTRMESAKKIHDNSGVDVQYL